MAPFVALVVTTCIARALGAGVPSLSTLSSWSTATAVGVAAMFTLASTAHFRQPRRAGLVAIVPTGVPRPELAVTVTGVLEIVGALGVLVPATRTVAAVCLALLLVAMFPANVRAASGPVHPSAPTTPLALRTALQVVFITACVVAAT
ncbi:DoxX family protein [Sanguibacter suaedae]|uniref:DoxX family protein n=1 Tax=Sanguibacter suaedae TaxID=2795737 RepID=A0A934I1D5_9MICO|nr:DoxX family protein [Sanguibacter suaedae]MBI9113403.1 DoxX family protein [Sanguibacter suaedae]